MHVTNPIVRGFAPDPSMIRVDDWYYLATSSFEWFPTIPLHRSRDLVHWEYAGCVDSAVPGRSLVGVPDSAGIWAPALSYCGGLFWVVYSIVRSLGTQYYDLDTFVCTAPAIAGPWSDPVRVPGHGFDPSLFHDDDGRHWLVNLQNDSRVGGERFAGIVATELDVPANGETLDPARMRAVGSTHLLLQHDTLVEGPKLMVKDGWYYLLVAEGGTGVEHGVRVARSRSLLGPYELDGLPLLTCRDDPTIALQKAGHGELVQAPTGEWFLAHLASRPVHTPCGPRNPLGRETAIQPIVWTEDWPRLAHGGWHPARRVTVPHVAGTAPDAGPGPTLAGKSHGQDGGFRAVPHWPWSFLREPVGDWLDSTSRPGWIRIRGRQGPQSLWRQSLVAQRLTEHQGSVSVIVDAQPTTFTQSAGLVLWYNTTSYYRLHITWAEPEGELQHGQQWQGRGRRVLVLEHRFPDGEELLARLEVPDGPIGMRAEWDRATARFLIDEPPGPQPVGPAVDMSELSDDFGPSLRFTGAFAGVSVMDLVNGEFTADFTQWRLRSSAVAPWSIHEQSGWSEG